jgi:hypothetical protein
MNLKFSRFATNEILIEQLEFLIAHRNTGCLNFNNACAECQRFRAIEGALLQPWQTNIFQWEKKHGDYCVSQG